MPLDGIDSDGLKSESSGNHSERDDINKLFLDYMDVANESEKFTIDRFLERVKDNPSFELMVWKKLSIKYFREIEN